MDELKGKVTGFVKDLVSSIDEDIEMLNTNGVVLKFVHNAPAETVDWICKLLTKPVLSGGGGLQLKKYEVEDSENDKIFILSATLKQLFQAADQFNLLKQTHDGYLKKFSLEEKYDFENFEDDNENFLLCSEQQYLLNSMLNNVICEDEDIKHVPGYPRVKVYKSRPVIPRCKAKTIIQIYPLHSNDDLKSLKANWYIDYKRWTQPLESIKKYFGETIALYFSFLEFYSKFLIPPAVFGFMHWFFFVNKDSTDNDNIFFAILNVIWATVFLELWKRKGATIAYTWGRLTINDDSSSMLEKPRAEYKGHPRISPVTGLLEPHYPTWRRRLKMYLVTYPLLVLSLLFAASGMWLYFEFKEHMMLWYKDSTGLWSRIVKKLPGVVYASLIYGLNHLYGKLAVLMNDWENHRVPSSYNNHLIVKLVLFYSVNSFLSLFYIAFYLQDMLMLKQHLATLLITQQLIQQVQESVFPYMKYKRHNIQVQKSSNGLVKIRKMRDPKNQVTKEGNLPDYSTTFQDYLELFLQFGYVFLFSAVYPLAAFWALLNNIIEIRTDAFKLCNLHQRPFTQPASSIGAWQVAFEAISIIAVMTNCALIGMSRSVQDVLSMKVDPIKYVILFVAIEHVVVLIKLTIARLIPDVPGPITTKLAKAEYKRKQLIKEKELWQIYQRQRASSEME